MNLNHAVSRIFSRRAVLLDMRPLDCDNGVTNRVASARVGVCSCVAELADGSRRCFVGKRKTAAIIANGIKLLCSGSFRLYVRLVACHKILGYNKSWVREAVLYNGFSGELFPYLPVFIGAYVNRLTKSCFVALEEFPRNTPSSRDVMRLIDVITAFHARYYGDEASARALKLNIYTEADYRSFRYSFRRMFESLDELNRAAFSEEQLDVIRGFIRDVHIGYSAVKFHQTLTHNDYSIRNISAGERVIIYDWELAAYQNPEHDVIELLISLLHTLSDSEIISALQYQRNLMAELTGCALTDEQYEEILRFNTLEFCVNKLTILRLAGKRLGLDYTEQLAVNTARFMRILNIT